MNTASQVPQRPDPAAPAGSSVSLPVSLMVVKMGYSSRRLAAFLFGYCDVDGTVRASLETLSCLTGIKNCSTLRKARDDLQDRGFLTYRFVHRSATIYTMNMSDSTFTIPRSLLLQDSDKLSNSAFSVQLFQYYSVQTSPGHTAPSINQTRRALNMPASTVCHGRKQLSQT